MRKELIILVLLLILPAALHLECERVKRTPNRINAISSLRSISNAEELYNIRYSVYGTMEEMVQKNLIDSVLASATDPSHGKSGYYFIITLSENRDAWTCITRPTDWGLTGESNYRN